MKITWWLYLSKTNRTYALAFSQSTNLWLKVNLRLFITLQCAAHPSLSLFSVEGTVTILQNKENHIITFNKIILYLKIIHFSYRESQAKCVLSIILKMLSWKLLKLTLNRIFCSMTLQTWKSTKNPFNCAIRITVHQYIIISIFHIHSPKQAI